MYHHLSADFPLEEAHNAHYRSHDLEIICFYFEGLILSHFVFGVCVEVRDSGAKILFLRFVLRSKLVPSGARIGLLFFIAGHITRQSFKKRIQNLIGVKVLNAGN